MSPKTNLDPLDHEWSLSLIPRSSIFGKDAVTRRCERVAKRPASEKSRSADIPMCPWTSTQHLEMKKSRRERLALSFSLASTRGSAIFQWDLLEHHSKALRRTWSSRSSHPLISSSSFSPSPRRSFSFSFFFLLHLPWTMRHIRYIRYKL